MVSRRLVGTRGLVSGAGRFTVVVIHYVPGQGYSDTVLFLPVFDSEHLLDKVNIQ